MINNLTMDLPIKVKSGNKIYVNARKNKNDEFYTQRSDIENELKHYRNQFKDKVILLPCDDPYLIPSKENSVYSHEKSSQFWIYFHMNFELLGLKKVIATHYNPNGNAYKIEYSGGNDMNFSLFTKTDLKGDGDFRSLEVKELFKEADVIVTNPPFSLFKEFIPQIMEYNKKFLIIGNKVAVIYKEIFPLIKTNKLWWGYTSPKQYIIIENDKVKISNNMAGLTRWFTNLEVSKHVDFLETIYTYENYKSKYPKYDNYDAIEVGFVNEIPMDYYGLMGVPPTFLDKYNPNQFEMVHTAAGGNNSPTHFALKNALLNGKVIPSRILIKRKEKK